MNWTVGYLNVEFFVTDEKSFLSRSLQYLENPIKLKPSIAEFCTSLHYVIEFVFQNQKYILKIFIGFYLFENKIFICWEFLYWKRLVSSMKRRSLSRRRKGSKTKAEIEKDDMLSIKHLESQVRGLWCWAWWFACRHFITQLGNIISPSECVVSSLFIAAACPAIVSGGVENHAH